jgi:hypothetical protein
VEIFNNSLNLIANEHIIELTWKILFELAEYYANRGNYKKAHSFIKYAKSVIYHIAEKIENLQLREIYLNGEDKKRTLARLNFLELKMLNE